ncbi:DMT family transporter [Rubrobacter taiwanensis]|jgi:drug/metabolite transporter (DMT)-like permease|uniref:DMT family transporter n=1 Tax=Rubrobacter taiwanensis TaxID=185139 RepID=A0A4R1BG08_9ACTN|nr:DMT family transporter [Rubrobacter taiwanensis]TCJ16110.1 DMT family transporter [Rubrobacter taiwanensis]
MRLKDFVLLLALAALWGASFMFIKVAVAEVTPVFLVAARTFLGVCAVLALLPLLSRLFPGQPGFSAKRMYSLWKPLLLLGVVNSALPFFAISWGELWISSSAAAILNSTTPLFAATLVLLLPGLPEDRLGVAGFAGLLIGVAGVAVLVGGGGGGAGGVWALLGHLAVLLGAAAYATGGLYARARLEGVPPLIPAVGQNLAGFLVVLPFALLFGLPDGRPGAVAVAALLGLGIGSTGIAYIIYFRLIANVGATKTLMVTYLVPAMGLLYGALLLGEEVTVPKLAGLALILLGVAGVTGRIPLPKRFRLLQ